MNRERPDIPKDLIEVFCRKHHLRKLSVYGSHLRPDFGPESDVDLFWNLKKGALPVILSLPIWSRNYPTLLAVAR
jgi:uncharacterized protein